MRSLRKLFSTVKSNTHRPPSRPELDQHLSIGRPNSLSSLLLFGFLETGAIALSLNNQNGNKPADAKIDNRRTLSIRNMR